MGWSVFLPKDFIEKYQDFVLNEGDIVCAMTRPILSRQFKIARLSKRDAGSLLNQRVCRIDPYSNISKEYLFWIMQHYGFVNQLEVDISGSDPPNVSGEQIESFKITLPPYKEQLELSSIISSMQHFIEQKNRNLLKTQSLKKSLMQDLLTGKVRVKVN